MHELSSRRHRWRGREPRGDVRVDPPIHPGEPRHLSEPLDLTYLGEVDHLQLQQHCENELEPVTSYHITSRGPLTSAPFMLMHMSCPCSCSCTHEREYHHEHDHENEHGA